MKPYLYLSLMPEALVASHLPPDAYGAYLSTGPNQLSRGSAAFFRLTDEYTFATLNGLGVDVSLKRTGSSIRRSAYLAIYRVLERTPLSAIESLHLATDDGRVLTLRPGEIKSDPGPRFHLYQEFCPVTPRVVSELQPREFGALITDQKQSVSLPALVFAELKLERLADDPEAADVDNLPYANLGHLRACLRELRTKPGKPMKTVNRTMDQGLLFRTLRGGFHVAMSGGGLVSFPMPAREELETTHYHWWRSALSSFGG